MFGLIKSKVIKPWITMLALYAGFCFAYFVPMRGTVALLNINYGLPDFLANDIFAFFAAGAIPLAVYEAVTVFAFRFIHMRGIVYTAELRYGLRFFFFGAALVMGGIRLIFMFFPVAGVWGNVLTDLIVPVIFFCLYLWFVLATYVRKDFYSKIIYELGGAFTIVYGAFALLELITGVL